MEWNTLIAGRGEENVIDAGELAHVLRGVELTADFLNKVKDALKASTEEAVKRGVFGAPTCFVNGEMFFGQDRLEFVREALRD